MCVCVLMLVYWRSWSNISNSISESCDQQQVSPWVYSCICLCVCMSVLYLY